MKFSVFLCPLLYIVRFCEGQSSFGSDDRGFLFNRRPALGGGGSWGSGGSSCGDDYDAVDPDQRSLLAVAGGAVVGGVIGGAAGYHLGMKNQRPVVINNNVINQLPSPCYSIPVHVTTGGGGGGGGGSWGGGGSGGGIVGGILSNHPILSNILQGGILGGGGGSGNRAGNRATNRNIRQFSRQVIRPITRIFK